MDRPDTIEDLQRNLNNFVKRSDENYAQCIARLKHDIATLMAGCPTTDIDATMEMAVKSKLAQIVPKPTCKRVLKEVNCLRRKGEPCPIAHLVRLCQTYYNEDCNDELMDQF